jgi:UDP-GlcNAc:undecaprenyl-phosphate GlcNAc-1-phosphate transferase
MLLLAGLNFMLAAGFTFILKQQLLRDPSPRLTVVNYRGVDVASVGGLLITAAFLAIEGVGAIATLAGYPVTARDPARAFSAPARLMLSAENQGIVIVAMGFFAFGLIDDLFEGGRARGFRGHLAALSKGMVTGGVIKIVGGGLVALAAGALWEATLIEGLGAAVIVALSANLLNLLDLRPGRTAKAFLIWWTPLAAASWQRVYLPVSAAVASACLVWLPDDLKERGMLGDAGANMLGAVAGAGLALALPPVGKVIALIALVLLTLASELWSFTAVIEKLRPLRWFDGLGRKFS